MKTRFSILVFSLLLAGVLAGCENGNEMDPDDPNNPNNPNYVPPLPPLPDPNNVCSAMNDINFMRFCIENYDFNRDGVVSPFEASIVSEIPISKMDNMGHYRPLIKAKSLKGIEYFPNIVKLDCREVGLVGTLDLRYNNKLTELDCAENQLTSLDVSGCIALEDLKCNENQLTSLDVSGCISLEELECYSEQLTSLDVSGCTSLKTLALQNTKLTSLDVSDCIFLEGLGCLCEQLTTLNVGGCIFLKTLALQNTKLTSLDVSSCASLKTLALQNTKLTSLDVSSCASLDWLYCEDNPNLKELWLAEGQNIPYLVIYGHTEIKYK